MKKNISGYVVTGAILMALGLFVVIFERVNGKIVGSLKNQLPF